MTYTRTLYQSPSKNDPLGTEWISVQYSYEQPLRDRLVYKIYHAWWLIAWKVKPIAWAINHLADPVRTWWHKRSCDGMCATWTYAKDGSSWTGCDILPMSAEMDCKLYYLEIKNNRNIKRL